MKVQVVHGFACTPDTFWKRIFFDREYNESLFLRELSFPAWKILEMTETPERVARKVHVMPPQKGPEVIRKFVKGDLSYEERGEWTAADPIYRFRSIPSAMAEKVKIEGVIRAVPDGATAMRRECDVEVTVSVMLVGGTIEKFLAGEIRSSYDRAAEFTQRWIRDRGM